MSSCDDDCAARKGLKRRHSFDTHEVTSKKQAIMLPRKRFRISDFNTTSESPRLTPQRTSLTASSSSINSSDDNSLPVIRRRCSTPGKRMDSPGAYSQASPWIADFLRRSSEGSNTPHVQARRSFPRDSKGPLLLSYQLLGDSLFVRFADQILHQRAVIGENGKFSNGNCVSGQTIEELIWRVDRPERRLEPNVIVLIGTNDFLKGSEGAEVREWMERLLAILRQKAHMVVVLTVPPIPRLGNKPSHWHHWEQHNEWIKSLDNGSSLRVIDVAPLFLLSPRRPDMSSFESYMGYGKRKRIDHIHLNRKGLLRLNRKICKHLEVPE